MTKRSNWNQRILTIENKGAAACRMGLDLESNPYTSGYRNQNGTGGQVQRLRAQAWTRGWYAAQKRRDLKEEEELPSRFKLAKDKSTHTLVMWFYFTGEPTNPWRCSSCITQRQRKEILEEVPQSRVLPGGTNICCRKCGMDFMA